MLLDPEHPDRIKGFEVEVAELLAQELGRTPEFVQNQWDGLIPGLQAGNYHIALNAIEITEERKHAVHFSKPYFYTTEQLTLPKDVYDIHSLDDLVGKKVGTIMGALAERILGSKAGIQVLSYESQTTLYEDLALGRLDAVLLDQPAALYYAGYDTRLKNLPQSFGEIAYGVAIPTQDMALLQDVNAALERLITRGTLRHVYERWGVWNDLMSVRFPDP
jgi:polar amino acid transport system substrate-binding protein